MKFCIKFFREINFEPDAISPCCNTHALKIPVFPYNGGAVDMRAYAAHIASCLKEIQQAGSGLCAGCPSLIDIEDGPGEIDLAIREISINMHRYFCNCKCVYCDLWRHRGKGAGYEILPALQSLHEQNILYKNAIIGWGGGESSILPEFEAASIWVMHNRYFQKMHTSGIKYSPAISRILKMGMGSLKVSMDSASPEIYKKVKGLNAFNVVFKNIARYCNESNPEHITLKYIIFDLNNDIKEVDKFLRMCKGLAIPHVEYSFDFREVLQNRVSDATIFTAAWFKRQADELGLHCAPFFVDRPLRERVEMTAKSLS